ncbi:MAG: FkbM family methyltransferase [Mycolicibacterium sp.]|uniref:FkbM family methyltransferase n=1 Tax=Mycolicibacterium sp. TaxID=2320850 RepID=UPI003D0D89FC
MATLQSRIIRPVTAVPRRLRAAEAVLTAAARRLSFVESEVRGLATVVGSGDVCMDVGAEYGLYSVPLARLVSASGRVIAVEPTPDLVQWLRFTARGLGARTLTVAPVALGARSGRGELSVPRRWNLPVHGRSYLKDGSIHPGPNIEFPSAATIPVRVQTLDGLCDELGVDRLDFLKIDVEGAELAILVGSEMVSRHRPTIMLEIEDRHLGRYGRRAADVFKLLSEKKYAMYGWLGQRWQSLTGPHPRLRNYLFTPAN